MALVTLGEAEKSLADHFIVMGDIQHSSAYAGEELMRGFHELVASCNSELGQGILSPYTITLGDEFQGVAASLAWAVRSLVYLEESRLRKGIPYTLRYVVHEGWIDMPVNRTQAYGMVGPGLRRARELLTDKRRGTPRFLFDLPDNRRALQLSRLLGVMYSLMRDWKAKDAGLIFEMLASDNNADIAAKQGKNRSQVWKRRKNLHVDDYRALRETALELSDMEGGE